MGTEPGAICSARKTLATLVIADLGFISIRSKPRRPVDWSWRSATGQSIEITPYATGRTKQFYGAGSRAWQGAVDGEFTWKITPQLVTVFIANTDFAETEVDTRQINLTRFPLFFPEKRAFFLEGANQYDFGLGLARQDSPQFKVLLGYSPYQHAVDGTTYPAILISSVTLRQSHVTKHADHYHLSAKRPSVLNDLFGPPPARWEFECCSPARWASRRRASQ